MIFFWVFLFCVETLNDVMERKFRKFFIHNFFGNFPRISVGGLRVCVVISSKQSTAHFH